MWETLKKNPISAFAVLCVAASALFLAYFTNRMATVLESSSFCAKALQAERITPGNTFVGLTSCVDLLKIQLQAMALSLHIAIGSFALVLVVLIVVVIAGARASWKVSTAGVEGSVGRDPPVDVKVVNAPSAPVPTTEAPKP